MSIASRLKLMSFLQYFIWGSWLVTLGSYMINTLHFTGANVGMVYSSKGLAAIIMPGVMGIIADKWLRAERAYMLCHLVCAAVLLYATTVTDPDTMFWVMLINAMAYMPSPCLTAFPTPAWRSPARIRRPRFLLFAYLALLVLLSPCGR